jgi:flagellar motor switch protein FliG
MPLTGPEKAVLMLLSLDENIAAPIVAELEDGDLRKLREVAAMMRAVPASAIDDVHREFVERAAEAIAVPRGGVTYLRRLASRSLGEARSQGIFVDAPESAISKLATADIAALASLLELEHPQLIAAILSQLEAGRAARVLETLPTQLQMDTLARLGSITEVPAGLLEEVAQAIAAELPPAEAEASMSVDGVSRAAAVVRKLPKQQQVDLLSGLTESLPEVAGEIRRAMFTFEDLKVLDSRQLRTLLKEVQSDKLVLALKTAGEEVKTKIFASMSSRVADLFKDDLQALGGVRLVDVEAAQREIIETAMRLESEGTISLGGDGDAMV